MIRNLFRDKRASALTTEASVIILIMVGLVYGAIMMNNGVRIWMTLSMAAREGARTYATTHSSAEALTVSKELCQENYIKAANLSFTPSSSGMMRKMEVHYRYPMYIPLLGGDVLDIKGVSVFHAEPTPE